MDESTMAHLDVAPSWGEAAELLWSSTAPYARRSQKLANSRTAIAMALDRREGQTAADREAAAFLFDDSIDAQKLRRDLERAGRLPLDPHHV